MTTYSEKLKDPRWQRKRLEILDAAGWECTSCGDGTKTLHVHHAYYERGRDPWDYPDDALHALCMDCHAAIEEARRNLLRATADMAPSNLRLLIGLAKAWRAIATPTAAAEPIGLVSTEEADGIAVLFCCSTALVTWLGDRGSTWRDLELVAQGKRPVPNFEPSESLGG